MPLNDISEWLVCPTCDKAQTIGPLCDDSHVEGHMLNMSCPNCGSQWDVYLDKMGNQRLLVIDGA